MKYLDFATTCESLSSESKRLELRSILSKFILSLSEKEISNALYMLQGMLRPEYEGIELGVGDAMVLKALSSASGLELEKLKGMVSASGDMGETAFKVLGDRKAVEGGDLTFNEVYDTLTRVATETGEGSQDSKTSVIAEMLRRASPIEAKHLVRFMLGKLRLGVKEMTIVDALAVAYGGSDQKQAKEKIESSFNVTSDLGEIGTLLAKGGLGALEKVGVAIGKPVRPMLAEREPSISDILERMGGEAALEYKYDGLRIQAHVSEKGKVQLFSRRLEDLSDQFPEILEAVPGALKRSPAIVEGECVPFDVDTGDLRPFQDISRRRGRKYEMERMMAEVPVKLLLFDVLLDGKESCLGLPYPERRRRLESMVRKAERVDLATREIVKSAEEGEVFFQKALTDGCEGVVAKSLQPTSIYRAGARGFIWIKYKREYTLGLVDTIDAVIVGAYRGRGKRAGWYGAFLMSVYDKEKETFPTLCKVGTGFDEKTLEELTDRIGKATDTKKPEEVDSNLTPDVWVEPKVVLELRGAELTLSPIHTAAAGAIRGGYGLALRFPRFTGNIRDDRSPTDCTTTVESVEMYNSQVRKAETDQKP